MAASIQPRPNRKYKEGTMVVVPSASVDQVKVITEHDILKVVGTVFTALVLPIAIWTFVSVNNKLGSLSDSINNLHEQIAVLNTKLEKYSVSANTLFNDTRDKISDETKVVQALRDDAGVLISIMRVRAEKKK